MNSDSDGLRDQLRHAVSPRYTVEDEIGRGGMAFVFRGCDAADHHPVAFKVLRPEYASALAGTRFSREIRLLSQLQHPGILPLLESGESGNLAWFVMPLVDGETLESRLRRERQLTFDLVKSIVTQVAAALDYAHDAGVVHRDIKPSNLFLAGDRVLVSDFGIAKDLQRRDGEPTTSTDVVVGTVLYMSPEQADSRARADRRTDVYALGCVTYEMLAGEPPFTGPNIQAVMARVQLAPAPSLRLLRPGLPPGVDVVIRKALAKSPADRYQRAGDFAAALTDPAKLEAAAREAQRQERPPSRWRWPAVAALVVLLAGLAMWLLPERPLSPNKVVVFPLGETPAGATREGSGVVVALMIGSALEYTQPLEWIDGLPRLDERTRSDASLLSASTARRIARNAGARWYVDGTVVRRGDSATVVLRLNDAGGDSVVGRASATRVAVEPAQAGLEAINQLLPRLLAPGQRASELSALADRRPSAVAIWLQAEREYRSFNFPLALEFARRAVKEDSALAIAAIRGAQAANWLNQTAEAAALADAAVRHVALLPDRVAPFARGLQAYFEGRADSAVFWFKRALATSPQWTEAHMSLGEVYYHLLPTADAPLDSLAEAEFTTAAADSGFSPPRFHLAELAIQRRDTSRALLAVQDFLRLSEGPGGDPQRIEVRLMLDCARAGRSGVKWGPLAARVPLRVLVAAKILSTAGAYPACAEDGFRAVFSFATELSDRWGGFLGLQGMLAAEGRTSELRSTVDSAMRSGLYPAVQLYVLDALAGMDLAGSADSIAVRAAADPKAALFALWLAGEWAAHRGDRVATRTVRDALASRAAHGAVIDSYMGALDARLALLEGDSAGAISLLRDLFAKVPQADLDWGFSGALAPDRLLLGELLLARGQYREASLAAGVFDHPTPVAFLPFLPASLEIRRRAALGLGRPAEARSYADRLAALGVTDRFRSMSRSSTPTPEAR